MSASTRIDILNFIIEYITKYGYPPTVREIGDGVGLKSTSSVHNHLQTMRLMGAIEGEIDKPRAIRVPGYEFVKKGGAK
jgi:repressor LexA